MIDLELIHDTNLEAYEPENIDISYAIKNYLLFTKKDGKLYAVISKKYMQNAFLYLSKLNQNFEILFLDEDSFERLYNRFLEIKTDKELALMREEPKEEEEEEFSLTEFLRTSTDILNSEESAPIIKFVNGLFYQAIKKRASDIHIETHEYKGEVRFRIDGVLVKNADLDKRVVNLIISRIKVISNLDISEKRVPQDGRTQVKIAGKTLDVRVSVLPTYYGERVVMRILMQSEDIPSLGELGFDEDLTKEFYKLLHHSHGMILVTGPTGSGKSTTLHSFLQELASPDKNIITVEDPVEYKAENINQIQVNEKVGLTFASALRSILRQDPDIVMVGEIRDEETAQIAIRAALTGHLVLSTLHTNNSTATITRLSDMHIEPFLISSSILGVLSQRLVRLLCPYCKEEDIIAEDFANEYKIEPNTRLYKAKGCKKCNYTGYLGRKAIGELLVMDEGFKEILKDTTNDHILREYAKKHGLITLQDRLKKMLINGETSLDEAVRIGLKDE